MSLTQKFLFETKKKTGGILVKTHAYNYKTLKMERRRDTYRQADKRQFN